MDNRVPQQKFNATFLVHSQLTAYSNRAPCIKIPYNFKLSQVLVKSALITDLLEKCLTSDELQSLHRDEGVC
jgi:hypothetical protein